MSKLFNFIFVAQTTVVVQTLVEKRGAQDNYCSYFKSKYHYKQSKLVCTLLLLWNSHNA